MSSLCRLLGDKTRVRLLLLLRGGPQDVTTLWHQLGLQPSTISHHLRLLRASGVVERRRRDSRVFYELQTPRSAVGPDGSVQVNGAGCGAAFLIGGLESA